MRIRITESQYKKVVNLIKEEHVASEAEFLQHYFSGESEIDEDLTPETDVDSVGQEPATFSLEALKSINTFAGRVAFCRKHLSELGDGSSRTVFRYDNNYVVKLAKNSKGLAQNAVEQGMDATKFSILAKCMDYDHYGNSILFVVMEKAQYLSKQRFEELTGISWYAFGRIFHTTGYTWDRFFDGIYEYADVEGDCNEEFLMDLENFCKGTDTGMGDIFAISTYGEVVRDGQPQVVIIDYGLNTDVWLKHYDPIRQENPTDG